MPTTDYALATRQVNMEDRLALDLWFMETVLVFNSYMNCRTATQNHIDIIPGMTIVHRSKAEKAEERRPKMNTTTERTEKTEKTEKTHDPMTEAKAAFGEWKKLMDEQWKRMDEMWTEMGRVEKQGLEQLASTMDEMSRVLKGSLDFAHKASTEFRTLAQQTARRANEVVSSFIKN